MAKDSLSDAIFEFKDKDRKHELGLPKVRRPGRPKPKRHRRQRGRPRAFDAFHTFSVMLLAFGLILQVVAVLVYA